MNSSDSPRRLAWRVALPLALSLSACVSAGSGTSSGNGGSSGGGDNGQAGSSGGEGGTGGRTGGGTGTGGTVVTGGGGRTGLGGTGVGGSPGVGGYTPNPDAGARPDLTGRKALLIVKDPGNLDPGDVLLEQLLLLRGMTVTYGSLTTPPATATSYNVVLMSTSLGSDTGAAVFKDVPVPMIVFYRDLFLVMGFVATSSGRGSADDTTPVIITDVPTPLASDLPGGASVLMTSAAIHSSSYGWAIPGGTAIKVAAVSGAPTEFAVFAYEKGAPMGVGTAPARRVGLGWRTGTVDALTVPGFKLQDAAISWTAGAP